MSRLINVPALLFGFGFGGLAAIALGIFVMDLNWPQSLIAMLAAIFGPTAAIAGAFWLDASKSRRERAELRNVCKAVLRSVQMEIDRTRQLYVDPGFDDRHAMEEITTFLSTCEQALAQLHRIFPALGRLDQKTLELLIHFEYAATGNKRIAESAPAKVVVRTKSFLTSIMNTVAQPTQTILQTLG